MRPRLILCNFVFDNQRNIALHVCIRELNGIQHLARRAELETRVRLFGYTNENSMQWSLASTNCQQAYLKMVDAFVTCSSL